MHGEIETSFLPRWIVMVVHTLTVLAIVWLLTGGQDLLPETFRQADSDRRALIAAFAVIYLIRTLFGMQVLLKRHFGWVEALIVLAIFMSSHAIFAGLALANPQPLSWWGGLVAAMLFFGRLLAQHGIRVPAFPLEASPGKPRSGAHGRALPVRSPHQLFRRYGDVLGLRVGDRQPLGLCHPSLHDRRLHLPAHPQSRCLSVQEIRRRVRRLCGKDQKADTLRLLK